MLCVLSAGVHFQKVAGRRTAAKCDMRHLAARDDCALCILDKLGARQRGRLRSCLHLLLVLRFRDAVCCARCKADKREVCSGEASTWRGSPFAAFLLAVNRQTARRLVISPGCSCDVRNSQRPLEPVSLMYLHETNGLGGLMCLAEIARSPLRGPAMNSVNGKVQVSPTELRPNCALSSSDRG